MKELTGEEVQVRASYSEKKQVKQYEPIDVSCSLTETCEPDKVEETYARLFLTCREFVKSRINAETPYVSSGESARKQALDFDGQAVVDPEDDEYPEEGKNIKVTT